MFVLATFRHDGALLLELLADWYTVLATAEAEVDDTEANARTLAAWQGDETLVPQKRRFGGPSLIRAQGELSRDYARGLAVPMGEGVVGPELARELRVVFRRAQAKAEARLAGGTYLTVLQGYAEALRAMRGDPTAYRRVEHTVVAIVADERYLRVAEDDRVRELVGRIDDEVGHLYNRYMDVAR
ncbi:hypothetical protein [Pimelobacter simplex]|uniref:hypothetical protein n=1 Tax=Nocardioides simplex TaxID=2045 RepID=UPI00214F8092|nr:hypothetical protein [Pimelobacter simplex]UUW89767.1 hypothetical protein M0M43_29170 [Pimelobacter simplex]UUW93596.1 hypothetical protein M0M48_17825 [Pimelobacter simplex]